MKLTLYIQDPDIVDIRPMQPSRPWMNNTPERFAYRCLPLNIGNSYGWSLHLKRGFTAIWDGGVLPESLTVKSQAPDIHRFARTNFGSGVLTFFVYGIFRTDPGWNLYVTGPPNKHKDGIAPLSAVIETDWSPYRFTMNWRFLRPNTPVTFKAGEPFCTIFPVQRGVLEEIEPEIRPMTDEPGLLEQHQLFMASRKATGYEDFDTRNEKDQGWQKRYLQGLKPDDTPGCPVKEHQIKLRMKKFTVKGFD